MNKFTLSLLLLLSIRPAFAQLNEISGKITDTQNGYPIPGATILIKELSVSTITNHEGNFTIRVANPGKVLLAITHIGYEPVNMTFNLENKPIVANISLKPGYQISNVVVVSASKRPEKIVDAPASIQVIGAKELEQFSGTNVNELIALVQGVEFTRSGVADITFNARGLHNAFNNKILQLVDGRNSMSSLSGNLPIMNRGTTIKDDIEKL